MIINFAYTGTLDPNQDTLMIFLKEFSIQTLKQHAKYHTHHAQRYKEAMGFDKVIFKILVVLKMQKCNEKMQQDTE